MKRKSVGNRGAEVVDDEWQDEGAGLSTAVAEDADESRYARQMVARRRLEMLAERKRLRELVGDDLWDDNLM